MAEIIPAVMPKTLDGLQEHVSKVRGFVHTVQIDVMDGIFVPSEDWPYTEKSTFEKLLYGHTRLPFHKDIQYEADLMIKEPEHEIGKWIGIGIDRIIFHVESTRDAGEVVRIIEARDGVEVGIALNIETPNEKIYPYIEMLDFVQCMGIARIGYQGEPFDERVIPKIEDLRSKYPDVILQVDGGVSLDTAPKLLRSGANRLVSGSAIWKSDDITGAIEKFKSL